ncbi:unnamed protein product [Neospora caninum Liverpool]|uniref:NcMCP6, putative n=1 Tax=Neospora caninum (strain Liverpool) TaxID=572307 RepID=F0VMS3_NEOCL|nr:uncharacterized protein NCLIV_054450 [Neospora caninum Liverpool]CBZ55019.1 unnamed protein product [Neospora caninum Liverpool]CEL69744.1 TPA: NcMCP6, putative [Neospora caninum Liverpool]|eukprot:XP_003885047.1 uncharacterized protein NCLIV_054450 [Neospora caninum Liverpool]
MAFNFFCLGSTIAAVLASSQPAHAFERRLFGKIENGAQPVSFPQLTLGVDDTLQEVLDEYCQKKFKALCASGDKVFCNRLAVARYAKGKENQDADMWRCFDDRSIVSSNRSVSCVDDCGNAIPCLGEVKSITVVHTTRHAEIQSLVARESARLCPSSQKAANAYCKTQQAGSVARKDAGLTSVNQGIEWRCYDPSSLAYEQKSTCASNCGEEVKCHGGRIDMVSEAVSAKHVTRDKEIQDAINKNKTDCKGKICVNTVASPAQCVD